jgi:FtsZ-binding cell division protein ZapB
MLIAAETPAERLAGERRQRLLLAGAWVATAIPLIAFAWLTYESVQLQKEVTQARAEVRKADDTLSSRQAEIRELEERKAALEAENATLGAALDAQRSSTKHYRDFAGVRIQFYRESDREVVEKALASLGFRIETRLGTSRLIGSEPNTIGFGKLVSDEDLRDIAVALVQAGFPLKRIAPAVQQPDPRLIQIYASKASDDRCGLLTVDEIRAGRTCGPPKSR